MDWRKRLAALLDPAAGQPSAAFSLGDRGGPADAEAEAEATARRLQAIEAESRALARRVDRLARTVAQEGEPAGAAQEVGDLSPRLDENLDRIRTLFRAPDNADLIIREVRIGLHPPVRAALVFLEGMADRKTINEAILEPLMLLAHLDHHLREPEPLPWAPPDGRPDGKAARGGAEGRDGAAGPRTGVGRDGVAAPQAEGRGGPGARERDGAAGATERGEGPGERGGAPGEAGAPRGAAVLQHVLARLLPGNQVEPKADMKSVVQGVLYGDTAIFLEGCDRAILVETKGFPLRSVSSPKTEAVVRGAYDAFNESFRTNVALLRKRIKDPRFVTEVKTVGQLSRTYVAICYVDGVANPKLVAEVRRRIENLQVDHIGEAGILEQFIEDRPLSLFPQTLLTERPDRVSGYLSEGGVAILADNSPAALVVPVTVWALLQTAEDYNLRWPMGTLLRYLRMAALLLALFTGALYVAVLNYHHEMVPTELLLRIAATRERVPFPAALELLASELAFELVREAGTRIPSVIGPTLGIVGALILGQAAVQAGIFSPIVVIITAASGLASSAIPNYSLAFTARVLRFANIFLAMFLGLFGLAVGIVLTTFHLAGLRSFGVPYLSPVSPRRGPVPDAMVRQPLFDMEMRPHHLRPADPRRQGEVARRWDPFVPEPLREQDRDGRGPGGDGPGPGGSGAGGPGGGKQ